MGFNYGYEKKKFDSRWKRLEVEYCDAGMSEEQIAAMKEYDWAWFCSQRVFQNHTQPIPCEQYDEVCGQSQLFRKFASLSYQWDVDKIDQTRYGWLASVENEQLLLRLKKLSKKDLELLTLLFVDGYRQIDVARLWHCSRSAVAQRLHTPPQEYSMTAEGGALVPREWCIHSGEMVHGGRRRGAPSRHAGAYSGRALRLRMDSPSIWIVYAL